MWTAVCVLLLPALIVAQQTQPAEEVHVQVQLQESPGARGRAPATVVWLEPADKRSGVHPAPPGRFTLLQKNRMFSPHLLVIPVGSVVSFPNADPFFHNVFSYFNGKRFDLGLYEAGTSKEITFSREGVSYIFCNIHPEMSAVILTIDTPLYGVADPSARLTLRNVPPGDYLLHVWVEGLMQPALDRITRPVQVSATGTNSITVDARSAPQQPTKHLNKFGQPYDHSTIAPY